MSRWVFRLVLAGLILGACVWGWRILFPRPEDAIRHQLRDLARAASFGGNEAPMAKLINSQKLGDFFTPDVQVLVDAPGHGLQTIADRDTLLQAALTARNYANGMQVEFLDINVSVAPDQAAAVANLTLKVRVAGERDFFIQEMKTDLRKTGRTWRIKRAETVRTLTRSPLPLYLSHA